MKFSWLFGNTMEQQHLLYVYLSVWLIQGGYFVWIAWKWAHTRGQLPPTLPKTSTSRERP